MNPNPDVNGAVFQREGVCQDVRILVWNVHGTRNKYFLWEFNEHVRTHKPQLVVLLETHISGEKAEDVCI